MPSWQGPGYVDPHRGGLLSYRDCVQPRKAKGKGIHRYRRYTQCRKHQSQTLILNHLAMMGKKVCWPSRNSINLANAGDKKAVVARSDFTRRPSSHTPSGNTTHPNTTHTTRDITTGTFYRMAAKKPIQIRVFVKEKDRVGIRPIELMRKCHRRRGGNSLLAHRPTRSSMMAQYMTWRSAPQ